MKKLLSIISFIFFLNQSFANNIEIGGGLGPLSNKIWRVGLMGETAKKENIQKLMDAFSKVL